jgi:hypothetical protein
MQDRHELSERGWKQMEALLDEKMPPKKFIIAWWMKALGICMIMSVLLLGSKMFFDSQNSSNVDSTQSKPLHVDQKLQANNQSNATSETELQQPILALKSEVSTTAPEISFQISNKETTENEIPKKTVLNLYNTVIANTTNKADIKAVNELTSKDELKNPVQEIVAPVSIASIDQIQLNLDHSSNFKDQLQSSLIIPGAHMKKWAIEAYTGLNSSVYSVPGGWQIGLLATRKVSNKANIQFGIGYTDINRRGFDPILGRSNRSEALSVFSDESILDYVNYDKSYASYEEASSLVNHLRYINIPVQLTYSLHPRINMELGMRYSYLVNAQNKIGGNIDVNNSLTQENASNNVLFRKAFYKRHDVALSGGLRYIISKTFSVGANWIYGLKPVLDLDTAQGSTDRNDFNKDVALNLYYTF